MNAFHAICLSIAVAGTAIAAGPELLLPRSHHYDFAHKTLVSAMREGEPFLETLQKKKTSYLKKLWREAGKTARDGKKLSAKGLDYKIYEAGAGKSLVIVVLPKPEAEAEAHMVGCLIAKDKKPSIIYTLEKAGEKTMLCGWKDQMHVNFGSGPSPSPEAFRDAILKKTKE